MNRIEVISGRPHFSGGRLGATSLSLTPASVSVDTGFELEGGRLDSVHVSIGDAVRASPASVRVANPGTVWDSSGRLSVGGVNGGVLEIESGAKVTSAEGRIGPLPVAPVSAFDNRVRVSGLDSSWDTGSLAVGLGAERAALLVSQAGTVAALDLRIGGTDCIECIVETRDLSPPAAPTLSVQRDIVIGDFGPGTLRIESGAQVVGFGGIHMSRRGTSELIVSGIDPAGPEARSRLATFGGVFVGDGFTEGTAQVSVEAGGLIALDTLGAVQDLTIGSTSAGTVTVSGIHPSFGVPSQILGAEQITVGSFAPAVLSILDGAEVESRRGTVGGGTDAADGIVQLAGGPGARSLWTIDDALVIGGSVDGARGEILLAGGELDVGPGGIQINANGALRGNGSIMSEGPIDVDPGSGVLAPGLSPGRLSITGDLAIAGGSVELEIGGPAPGTQHDVLDVDGNVTLGGELVIRFIHGFAPRAGDRFALLPVTGSVVGAFDGARIENLEPGFDFELALDAGALTLVAKGDGTFDATADSDGDGVPDLTDNCPAVANDQANADGDAYGDACECGDMTGDGRVTRDDARQIQRCAVGRVDCVGLCDATGEGTCNTTDARLVQRVTLGRLSKSELRCAERP